MRRNLANGCVPIPQKVLAGTTFPETLYGLDPGPSCPRIVRMIDEIPKNPSDNCDLGTGGWRTLEPAFEINRASRRRYMEVVSNLERKRRP